LIDWGTEKSAKQKDGDTMEDPTLHHCTTRQKTGRVAMPSRQQHWDDENDS